MTSKLSSFQNAMTNLVVDSNAHADDLEAILAYVEDLVEQIHTASKGANGVPSDTQTTQYEPDLSGSYTDWTYQPDSKGMGKWNARGKN